MVSAATVPTSVYTGIRRKLNHSKRCGCSGKCMPMPACSNERIDILRVIHLRGSSKSQQPKAESQEKIFHVKQNNHRISDFSNVIIKGVLPLILIFVTPFKRHK